MFNRTPFVEAVEAAGSPAEVRDWLIDNGYTHVYVGWSEIQRLQRSRYGFAEAVTPDLFRRLTDAGVLRRIHTFSLVESGRPYAELYEVVWTR